MHPGKTIRVRGAKPLSERDVARLVFEVNTIRHLITVYKNEPKRPCNRPSF